MVDTTDTRKLIDIISQSSGLGALSSSYAELLSGFNHRSLGSPVPINAEHAGITFFTRPNMNLSGDNLIVDRMLTPLLTQNPMTLQRAIRAMLDPVSNVFNDAPTRPHITSPLFDETTAFIPLLTNGLKSLSGWPDIALDTHTSKEGVLRENWSMVDGTHKTFSTFDLQASFRNYGGDPISLLLAVWVVYMSCIYRGSMVPYMKSIVTNRVDYHSRIFRFTLDPTSRTRIQKWSSTTGVFPVGVPFGASMNFNDSDPYTKDNAEEVSINFRCHGAEYMDPILFEEFNETVQMFNPNMVDGIRQTTYQKVPYQFLKLFNYRGHPFVDVRNQELEWWVENDAYQARQTNFASLKQLAVAPTANSKAPTETGSVVDSFDGFANAASNIFNGPAAT